MCVLVVQIVYIIKCLKALITGSVTVFFFLRLVIQVDSRETLAAKHLFLS